jgi:tetratricopeptide (TPR) repeat protein
MLSKLKAQTGHAVALQKDGDFSAALTNYELIFEALHYYDSLGYKQETDEIRCLCIESQPTPVQTLYCHALALFYRRCYQSALDAAEAAQLLAPQTAIIHLLLARIHACIGNFQAAQAACQAAEAISGEVSSSDAGFMLKAMQLMPGDDYYDWLEYFHNMIKPATYVEIGLGHGRSLALAGNGTRAIGIDPYQGILNNLNYFSPDNPATLFPLASDDFFKQHDLRQEIGKDTFDLAFIDGLHLFEQVLKDFINLERYAGTSSVILIHDCLPVEAIVAERERCTGFWTGDVWRIIPCLKTFRPDLRIMTIPTYPSGLGVVTNLDPASTVLSDNYDAILVYYLKLKCPETFDQRRVVCSAGSTDKEYIRKQFCNTE